MIELIHAEPVGIHAFACGRMRVPRALMVGGEGLRAGLAGMTMPLLAFAIELSDGSWILVDAGVEPGLLRGFERFRTLVMGAVSRGEEPAGWAYGRRLAEMGIEPARVRAVCMTHFDYDHTGGLARVRGRPVYASEAEWGRAAHPTPQERLTKRLSKADLDHATVRRQAALRPDPDLPHVAGAFSLPETGGGVRMVSLPGHTVGHCGVLVRLRDGRRALLTGDSTYSVDCIVKGRPLGLFPHVVANDVGEMNDTLARLRRWHEADREMAILPSHDPEIGRRCTAGPVRIL